MYTLMSWGSCDSLKFSVRVSVLNVGAVSGTDVVMLFSRPPRSVGGTPKKQLIGFDRIHAIPNGYAETSILVDPCTHLSVANESGRRVLSVGEHVLMLGDMEHSVSIENY